jgi:hypothetical protein
LSHALFRLQLTDIVAVCAEHAEERSKLTVSLARLWEAMFKLPLSLKYYNIPN